MICPFRNSGYGTFPCERKECELWDSKFNGCCLKSIAVAIRQIYIDK